MTDDRRASSGARLMVAALEEAGVRVAFGLPGVHNLALWRELGPSPIRLVALRGHVAVREPTLLVARAALGPPPNVLPRWYRR